VYVTFVAQMTSRLTDIGRCHGCKCCQILAETVLGFAPLNPHHVFYCKPYETYFHHFFRFNPLTHLFSILALPFYVTFTAGAIAGVSEILTFYPLGAPPQLYNHR
jgi:hypothetical protein